MWIYLRDFITAQRRSREVENAPAAPIFGEWESSRGGVPDFSEILRNFGFSGESAPATRPAGPIGFVFEVRGNPIRASGARKRQYQTDLGVWARFRLNSQRPGGFCGISVFADKEGQAPDRMGPVD